MGFHVRGQIHLFDFHVCTLFDVNLITLFSYIFEEFIFDVAECNTDRRNYFYLILKHKKKNIDKDYLDQLKNLTKVKKELEAMIMGPSNEEEYNDQD